jgi:hypothetical protein
MRSLAVLFFLLSTALGGSGVGMSDGDLLLDVELPTADGKTARLSDFAGKKLVLIHFASW